ncbi:hypothetical protein B0O80DRAFT_284783 [Mortierella sp. GBAus27b]|nr:hypothetical protein B0O80DRAFT_284783 [Mortierella sp. GBAus27b]
MSSFLRSHQLPPGYQYSHGFLACVITIVLSLVVAIMLTIDWRQGFPSAGLSATLKALIISSFMMTIVIIIGAVVYSWLEGWTFDESVNFCIVSFSTIGYGNLSPRSVAGRVFFFFYGILGVSAIGFFIVSLRNAVVEQFQWRLIEQFSRPAHINRVQTRMSVKDLSYPMACLEEEVRVKTMVKRKMILGMIVLWLLFWFGGAGVFCAFEKWTFLESLYFCYVTLTTIGFGDYVPNEPGSIEFWNIYVFIGLTIFAYILSLFSESMSSHFQLVDDVVVDEDEDLYGWEQCDGDLHTSDAMGRKGILGLEGYEWYRQNQQRRIPGHRPQYGGDSKAELSSKNPSGSQTKDQDHSTRQSLGGGIYATDGVGAGRVLEVPAKASRQMSQAEYYAAHGGSSIGFSDNDNSPNSACMPSPADTMSTQYRHYDSLGNAAWRRSNDTMRLDSPTTIRLVGLSGAPYRQLSVRRIIQTPVAVVAQRGLHSSNGSIAGSSIASVSSCQWNSSMHGLIYGTAGYHSIMARRLRCGGPLATSLDALPSRLLINTHGPQVIRRAEPCSDSQWRSKNSSTPCDELGRQEYLRTSALEHQPQVKFESPGASPRSQLPQRSPQSPRTQPLFGNSTMAPSSAGLSSPSQRMTGQGQGQAQGQETQGILKISYSGPNSSNTDSTTGGIRDGSPNHSARRFQSQGDVRLASHSPRVSHVEDTLSKRNSILPYNSEELETSVRPRPEASWSPGSLQPSQDCSSALSNELARLSSSADTHTGASTYRDDPIVELES